MPGINHCGTLPLLGPHTKRKLTLWPLTLMCPMQNRLTCRIRKKGEGFPQWESPPPKRIHCLYSPKQSSPCSGLKKGDVLQKPEKRNLGASDFGFQFVRPLLGYNPLCRTTCTENQPLGSCLGPGEVKGRTKVAPSGSLELRSWYPTLFFFLGSIAASPPPRHRPLRPSC